MSRHRATSLPPKSDQSRWLAIPVMAGAAVGLLLRPAPAAESGVPQIVAAPVARVLPTAHPRVAPVAVVKPQRIPPITGAAGLAPRAAALAAYLQQAYPDVREIGGVRPCDRYMEHCRGVALDVMVGRDAALGDRVTADVLAQAPRFGIRFVIWRETLRRPNGIRAWMADRGSATANHFDHVHIRVEG